MENMSSDVFIERIVKKRISKKGWLMRSLLLLGGAALCFASFYYLMSFFVFIWAAIIFGIYKLYTAQNIEYEYIVTNGEMDVDKIINRSRRKRVITVNSRDFEVVARVNDPDHAAVYKSTSIKSRVNVASGDPEQTEYFCIFTSNALGRTCLTFNPDERMLGQFQKFAIRKVFP